jgi:antigen flippase
MGKTSYRSILKSTTVVGSGTLINLVIGMLRTKLVALLLGPHGVGLMGLYQNIVSMFSSFSGLGLDTSGVRKIAEAHGAEDQAQISRLVRVLVRVMWLTGGVGCLVLILGAHGLSVLVFGTEQYATEIAWLGVAVLLGNVMLGQTCLLQGTRQISLLAQAGVVGSASGLVFGIPCIVVWGLKGVVPAMLVASFAMLGATWWLSRRVARVAIRMSWAEGWVIVRELMHFGLPVMATAVVAAISGYFIRALLVREFGLEGAGIWQAAFNLSNVLASLLLGAMVTDYYPRLVAVAGDSSRIREVVNAQTEIALLLAVPVLMLTMTLAPPVITIFYSGRFDGASEILRWFVLGLLGRVATWPMGLVLLAKGRGKTYFVTELSGQMVYIGSIWIFTEHWGLRGTGLAFLVYYLFLGVVTVGMGKYVFAAQWTRANRGYIFGSGLALFAVGGICIMIPHGWLQYAINMSISAVLAVYCLWQLSLKSGITMGAIKGWLPRWAGGANQGGHK